MVLGFLLYEAVDLAWNFGGMTYRGGKNIYNWYYQVPSQDDIEIKELEEIKKRMAVLEDLLRSQQSKKLDDK